MALFRHIFDFNGGALARLRDKRKSRRYPVVTGFPLHAAINLAGDEPSRGTARRGSGRDWSGPIVNISSTGLRIHLSPAAASSRGEETVVALAVDGFELRMPCRVAHFRSSSAAAVCGVTLDLEDPAARKGYLQLVETLAIGAEFAPLASKRPKSEGGLLAETYVSGRVGRLVAWRQPDSAELARFELRVGDWWWRGAVERAGLEIKFAGEPKAASTASGEESRRLFRWVALNLPRSVPLDLRELLAKFANDRGDWRRPPPI